MSKKPAIKICGLTTPESLQAAMRAGASYAGLVFYEHSPRAVSPDRAVALSTLGRHQLKMVGLFVDPNDVLLEFITQQVGLDFIQLHGDETPQRVRDIRARFGLPVIKAIRVATKADLGQTAVYAGVSDWLLFDAKVTGLQGGTGTSFDWALLKGLRLERPWMLSGGLTSENIGTALSLLQPDAVDASSGVEDAPGVKSPEKIAYFIQATRAVPR
jgi:phosphoribosylanthranilate isomerase